MTLRATIAERLGVTLPPTECPSGKVRYATKRAAQHALRRYTSHDEQRHANVYRCDYCDGYHIGHRRGR